MSEPLHMLVPLKASCTNLDKPFPEIRSFLVTAVILQYLGHGESFDFLQNGNHSFVRVAEKWSEMKYNFSMMPLMSL